MSFSKAKVQRFNETTDCTPSPAKYNVSLSDKIKLGIISKSGKKKDDLTKSDTNSIKSVHSTPCFQTPTAIPLRRKLLRMSFRSSKVDSIKVPQGEELRDKIVECNNKDLYIHDLIEQLDEIRSEYNQLKVEKENHAEEVRKENLKNYKMINTYLKDIEKERREIRKQSEELRNQNLLELSNILIDICKLEDIYKDNIKTIEEEHENTKVELKKYKEQNKNLLKELNNYKKRHQEDECKISLLEENFKDLNLLSDLQMKEKIDEISQDWQKRLLEKEFESEAILKECQEISEYNIIQCEIEKNQIKNELKDNQDLIKHQEKEISSLKNDKHAYEISIATFKDTIGVLKTRLINSDNDVEQLKSEIQKNEKELLNYEEKLNQLKEEQRQNEDLQLEYESTANMLHKQVKKLERELLDKIDVLKKEAVQVQTDKRLFQDVLNQYHEQQALITEAQETIQHSYLFIEVLEKRQEDLTAEIITYKNRLEEEVQEGSEIRKKYIETSGKYDKLAHQFEQILQELDQANSRIDELESAVKSHQEQVDSCENELKTVNMEKASLVEQNNELNDKYAQLVGHQNHNQKVKHLNDLKVKTTELFQKNIDLESQNFKLKKTVEKVSKELEDYKKKRGKFISDEKENIASPKCLKETSSPGPLKNKN